MPTTSIVMPCCNAAEHLPPSVGSVLAQTFSNRELIAVDDGSADSTSAYRGWHNVALSRRITKMSNKARAALPPCMRSNTTLQSTTNSCRARQKPGA